MCVCVAATMAENVFVTFKVEIESEQYITTTFLCNWKPFAYVNKIKFASKSFEIFFISLRYACVCVCEYLCVTVHAATQLQINEICCSKHVHSVQMPHCIHQNSCNSIIEFNTFWTRIISNRLNSISQIPNVELYVLSGF